jgi:signal transduction histidine kinase
MEDPQRPSPRDRIDEGMLLSVLSHVKDGDLSVRMPLEWTGVAGKIADRLNDVIAAHAALAEQSIEVELKNQEIELAMSMSLELRTPLNRLLSLAREVEHRVIHSSRADLVRLLDDIVELAKVEAGAGAFELSELSVLELQDTLRRSFAHVADQKGLAFSVELAPDLPPIIATDPGRLRQVLTNLLSNAFKFTECGEVSVRLHRAGTATAISVADTGIGIADELQRSIFEAFNQAEAMAGNAYGGTGLGLTITRELVRVLGGQIALRSTPGSGSTFTVYSRPLWTRTPSQPRRARASPG